MDSEGIDIKYNPVGRNGKRTLSAHLSDGSSHTDDITITSAASRKRFVNALCDGREGIDREEVACKLEEIAAQIVEAADAREGDAEGVQSDGRKPSQADLLVQLAGDAELFHTPGGYDADGYATIRVGEGKGHRETWPVNSKAFRRWLAQRFYREHKKASGSQALQDALNVIAGKAIHDGAEYAVSVRIAERDDEIWLDLADAEWRAVCVTTAGWQVVDSEAVPVRFIRKRGMLDLPMPVRGGSVEMLRRVVNLPDNNAWALCLAWMVAALRPHGPYPILIVNGEQGSAKTTLCRFIRALIDPNTAPLRRPPTDDRDMLIAACNGWIVAFDNLSGISPALSDVLCMLSTGGGFATRELVTVHGLLEQKAQ